MIYCGRQGSRTKTASTFILPPVPRLTRDQVGFPLRADLRLAGSRGLEDLAVLVRPRQDVRIRVGRPRRPALLRRYASVNGTELGTRDHHRQTPTDRSVPPRPVRRVDV